MEEVDKRIAALEKVVQKQQKTYYIIIITVTLISITR